MVRAKVAAAFAAALLAACAQEPPQVPEAPPPPMIAGQCEAQPAQFIVGQEINDPLAEQARVKAQALSVRLLRPGMVTTLEFVQQRLSIDVDGAGKVARVRCG